jgi:hypothetical protein
VLFVGRGTSGKFEDLLGLVLLATGERNQGAVAYYYAKHSLISDLRKTSGREEMQYKTSYFCFNCDIEISDTGLSIFDMRAHEPRTNGRRWSAELPNFL